MKVAKSWTAHLDEKDNNRDIQDSVSSNNVKDNVM